VTKSTNPSARGIGAFTFFSGEKEKLFALYEDTGIAKGEE